MDDFILLLPEKEDAKKCLNIIKKYIKDNLNLDLNSKSKYFPNKFGIDFCGYRIYESHIILRKRFKKKLKKSIRIWKKLKEENKLNYIKFIQSWNSFKGHAKHSNSYSFLKKYGKEVESIFQ